MNTKLFLYVGILIFLISISIILLANLAQFNQADKNICYILSAFGFGTGVIYIRFYKILK